jgi:hypothetical protein
MTGTRVLLTHRHAVAPTDDSGIEDEPLAMSADLLRLIDGDVGHVCLPGLSPTRSDDRGDTRRKDEGETAR